MNKMRVTEERLAVLIQMCNEMGIDTMKKALESSLKNELTEALLGFVMVSTSSKSSNIINENIMDVAVDITADIINSNNGFIDKIFKVDDEKDIFRILSRVIKCNFIDMLRKKINDIDDIDNHPDKKDESSNIEKIIEEKEKTSNYISKMLDISNLYNTFCFVMIRYDEYKPKELFKMMENIQDEEEFTSFAMKIFKLNGYVVNINSIKKIGFKRLKDAKAISDAARCVAITIKKHIHEFDIIVA